MARRSLKPQLNQIRTWVRQGRTDAWIAHQLEVSVRDIDGFKREHGLAASDEVEAPPPDTYGPPVEEEPDLRAEDDALVAAALEEVELLERLDFHDFKISVKSTSVPTMIRAYRMLAAKVPYPLHLGVTEAGTPFAGAIKSAVGIGSLLADGIGDTLRVSLTSDPVKEVEVAWEILKALGLRERGPVMVACPSCGRDNVGVETLAVRVEERLRSYPQAFEVAVMGCAVNGPGEAGDADFGIAGGRDVGFVYAHGRVLKKVSSDILVDELFHEIDAWIASGMPRPKRLRMAKPAALAMAEASLIPLAEVPSERV